MLFGCYTSYLWYGIAIQGNEQNEIYYNVAAGIDGFQGLFLGFRKEPLSGQAQADF